MSRDNSFQRQRKTFPRALPTPSPSPPPSVTSTKQHSCNTRAANATLHLARIQEAGGGRARAPHHVDRAKISPLLVILSSLNRLWSHISHEVALPFLVFLHPQNYMRESAVVRMRVIGIKQLIPMSLVTSASFGILRTLGRT